MGQYHRIGGSVSPKYPNDEKKQKDSAEYDETVTCLRFLDKK